MTSSDTRSPKGSPVVSGGRAPEDRFGRPLRSLRISVTDRCNLRCNYCMPQKDYVWLPRQEILTFEEIVRITDVFTRLGVEDVRLTGGEPLLRRDLAGLVRMLAGNARIRDLSLTTNGILLGENAPMLRDAGLHRVTVSLDTLRPERFRAITGQDMHDKVLAGIQAARHANFPNLKIDAVVRRGSNDDELTDLIEFGRHSGAEVRFIEYMDVGGATEWSADQVFTCDEMLEQLEKVYGTITPIEKHSSAPAARFLLPDGTVFGVIASTTKPFCRSCDRSRLTADGLWFLCLYARSGIGLREMVRGGASAEELAERISSIWMGRSDRGAELRAADENRAVLVGIDQLRENPHLEMHTRGG